VRPSTGKPSWVAACRHECARQPRDDFGRESAMRHDAVPRAVSHLRGASVLRLCVGILVVPLVIVATLILGANPNSSVGRIVRAESEHAGSTEVQATVVPDKDPELPPIRATASSPVRVLEIGDSLGIDLGVELQDQLDAGGDFRTTVASVGDSGLANLAYYNWLGHLQTLLGNDDPEIVVVFLGANDDQGLLENGVAEEPGTQAWDTTYAQRVRLMLTEARGAGARVVWVGLPPMGSPGLNGAVKRENAIFQQEADSVPGCLFVSADAVLGGGVGFSPAGQPLSSETTLLRTPDGVHLSRAGAEVLARYVISAFGDRWIVFGAAR